MAESSTTRLEAFSDGVFAIAITLLILEIKVPAAAEIAALGGLWAALAERWPSYVGYILSFFVIGIMWVNHHALFTHIRRIDRLLLLANLLMLMTASFLPYPTAVLAEHLSDPATRTSATVFYGATLISTSATFNLLWWTGRFHGRLLGPNPDSRAIHTISIRYGVALGLYATATALAFVNVWLSLAIHLTLALANARSERKKEPEGARL